MAERVKVLIAVEMEEKHLTQVKSVSSRLDATYLSFQKLDQVVEEMLPCLTDTEVLFSYRASFDLAAAPRLKWLQTTGAGVDYLHDLPIMKSDVVVTNAHLFGAAIAEYVFLSILSFRRRFPEMLAEYRQNREWPSDPWRTHRGAEISQTTLGIVGYGNIGRTVARIGRGFGMKITATRASAREAYQEDGVQILPLHRLLELLAMSDQVVICLPLTRETERLIGERELKAMKREAYLVNVGRGKVIDEDALLRALRERWIAGAGLDVHGHRPLRKDSPFFGMPNVLLTPHISGVTVGYEDQVTNLFCENLRRYLNGDLLLNIVDKARGY